MANFGGNPTLRNLIFKYNQAEFGGGLHNFDGGEVQENVQYLNNIASHGGGLGITYAGEHDLANVTFSENKAHLTGGGLFNANGTVALTEVDFSGNTAVSGGGIFNGIDGSMTISHSRFTSNTTTVNDGGGIANQGVLNIRDSEFETNQAKVSGGALFAYAGKVTIDRSTFKENVAKGFDGGAIDNNGAELAITNSTFSGNEATRNGGALSTDGHIKPDKLTNVTIYANKASGNGGGVYVNNGEFSLVNSIIANNAGGDCDDLGTINSQGYNIASDATCDFGAAGDSNSTDPKLGPYESPGIHDPHPSSPAIDSGSGAACPTTDQRNFKRPVDGDNNGTARCDIGAVEYYEPIASVGASNNSPTTLGQPTKLTAAATGGTDVRYRWDFGDGKSGSQAVVNHTYAKAGTYTAKVTASNPVSSKTDTTQVTITSDERAITCLPMVVSKYCGGFPPPKEKEPNVHQLQL
jgi:predicted outer membrane repeat protein